LCCSCSSSFPHMPTNKTNHPTNKNKKKLLQ
jgi:hypothetical protein